MSGRYLLHTNVAIQLLNEKADFADREDGEYFVCTTVVGELFFGASKSARPDANRRRVLGLVEVAGLLPQDVEVAERYGAVKADLKGRGRPIPENDLWIAATALRHGVELLSRDRHFDEVEGLTVVAW